MSRKIALWVSIIFQPLLMPTLLFTVLFNLVPEATHPIKGEAAFYMILALVITTFILPLLSIVAIRYSMVGHGGSLGITGLNMENRQERIMPLLFTTLFYAGATFLFVSKFKVQGLLIIVLTTITLIISLVTLINVYFKISAHSAAIWGIVGFLYGIGLKFESTQLIIPLILSVIIAGFVMSSRLFLRVHNPQEVWLGGLLGFTISISSILIFIP